MRRVEVSPAAMGSLALHAGVAAALMISWGTRDLKVGSVVPVTIVSKAPDLDVRPAVQAPEPQPAMTETPVPDAPAEPIPPAPEPTPAPVPPPKAAKPVEKAPAPKPDKPQPKAAEKTLDLDALAASLSTSRPASKRPSAAAKGPARPETAPVARDAPGSGLAAGAALSGLAEELQRRWNPNCTVEGGDDVQVRVSFMIGAGGQVVGDVTSEIRGARSPVAQAAADRAVRAVYAAAPFRSLPRDFYGDRIAVNFNAREACARR